MKTALLQVIALAAALFLPLGTTGAAQAASRMEPRADDAHRRVLTKDKEKASEQGHEDSVKDHVLLGDRTKLEGLRERAPGKRFGPKAVSERNRARARDEVEAKLASGVTSLRAALGEEAGLRKLSDGLANDETLPKSIRESFADGTPIERQFKMQNAVSDGANGLSESQRATISAALTRFSGVDALYGRIAETEGALKGHGMADPRGAVERRLKGVSEATLSAALAHGFDRIQALVPREQAYLDLAAGLLTGHARESAVEGTLTERRDALAEELKGLKTGKRAAELNLRLGEINGYLSELSAAEAQLRLLGIADPRRAVARAEGVEVETATR